MTGGSQTTLARKANVSQNAIWKLLNGITKQPTYATAVKLEEAVGGEITRIEFMDAELSPADESVLVSG